MLAQLRALKSSALQTFQDLEERLFALQMQWNCPSLITYCDCKTNAVWTSPHCATNGEQSTLATSLSTEHIKLQCRLCIIWCVCCGSFSWFLILIQKDGARAFDVEAAGSWSRLPEAMQICIWRHVTLCVWINAKQLFSRNLIVAGTCRLAHSKTSHLKAGWQAEWSKVSVKQAFLEDRGLKRTTEAKSGVLSIGWHPVFLWGIDPRMARSQDRPKGPSL